MDENLKRRPVSAIRDAVWYIDAVADAVDVIDELKRVDRVSDTVAYFWYPAEMDEFEIDRLIQDHIRTLYPDRMD